MEWVLFSDVFRLGTLCLYFIIKTEILLPSMTKSSGWENRKSGWEKLGSL